MSALPETDESAHAVLQGQRTVAAHVGDTLLRGENTVSQGALRSGPAQSMATKFHAAARRIIVSREVRPTGAECSVAHARRLHP